MKKITLLLLLFAGFTARAGFDYNYNIIFGEFGSNANTIVIDENATHNTINPTYVLNYGVSTSNTFFINSTGASDISSIGIVLGPNETTAKIVASYKINTTATPNAAVGAPQVNIMSPGSAINSYSVDLKSATNSTPLVFSFSGPSGGNWDSISYPTGNSNYNNSGYQMGDSVSAVYTFYHTTGTTDTLYLDNFRIEINSLISFDIYSGTIAAKKNTDGVQLNAALEGAMDIRIERQAEWSGEKAIIYEGPADKYFEITDKQYLLPGDYVYTLYGVDQTREEVLDAAKINIDTKDKIVISPNPFTDIIKVESVREDIIYVINSFGQMVHKQDVQAGSTTIDLSALTPGAYYLKSLYGTSPIQKK